MNLSDKLWGQGYLWLKAHLFMWKYTAPTPIETQDLKILPMQGAEKYALFYRTGWSFAFCLDTSEIRNPRAVQLWLSASSSMEPLSSAAATTGSRFWSPCWYKMAVLPLFFRPDIILVSVSVITFSCVFHKMGTQNWRCFSRCQTLRYYGYLPLWVQCRVASGLWSV